MRVLVTWGSKRGGTEGIGRIIGDELAARGFDVFSAPASQVRSAAGFDAAIVGGALYANRWPASVRRFVRRNVSALRTMPVWMFSSGPLDDSADREDIAPPEQVGVLAERVGARDHVTFGGRLLPDARGFPAHAMARAHAGDWRNPERIRAWAGALADALPSARPGRPVEHPAYSVPRLLAYGALGWSICATLFLVLLAIAGLGPAILVHGMVAPFVFVAVAWLYFRARGAREPLPTALTWIGVMVALDLVVAAVVDDSATIFARTLGTWLPFALVFFATWATGALMSTRPWPTEESQPRAPNEPATR